MANHKSAQKRARQTVKKTAVNTQRKSAVKSAVKALRDAIAKNDTAQAKTLLPKAQSLINKLAKVGVIKKQTAGRRTSRLAEQVSKLK